MNKRCKRLIVFAMAWMGLALTSPVHAQDSQSSCGGFITNIYFGNGVGVTPAGAQASRNALRVAYAPALIQRYPDERFIFRVAYNPTLGSRTDVKEVFIQRNPEYADLALTSVQLLVLAQMSTSQLERLQIAISCGEIAPGFEWLQTSLQDSISELAADARAAMIEQLTSPDGIRKLNELVQTNEYHHQLYRNNLDAGQRVIVVAHSQGNLFANHNVEIVRDENDSAHEKNIGIVGVATPADRVLDGFEYVTAHDDEVIWALSKRLTVLPSNIENDITALDNDDPRDATGHFFVQSYLHPRLPSRANIDNQLFNLVAALEYPMAEIGDGAIRATLEWGDEPDLDLHVYEPAPESTHVYYSDKIGLSGHLDRDDTNGLGPENYSVQCDQLRSGTYQFGVNYYSGSNPENARLQVSTSDGQVTSNNKLLTEAVGSSGNDNPYILVTVDVAVDANGRTTFPMLHGRWYRNKTAWIVGQSALVAEPYCPTGRVGQK